VGYGESVPLPIILFRFELKMASFGAFWELILMQLNTIYPTSSLSPIAAVGCQLLCQCWWQLF